MPEIADLFSYDDIGDLILKSVTQVPVILVRNYARAIKKRYIYIYGYNPSQGTPSTNWKVFPGSLYQGAHVRWGRSQRGGGKVNWLRVCFFCSKVLEYKGYFPSVPLVSYLIPS